MKKWKLHGRMMSMLVACACTCAYFGAGNGIAQTDAPAQSDLNQKKSEAVQKSEAAPSGGAAGGGNEMQAGGDDGRLGVLQTTRNPIEAGINARSITARSFIDYVQADFSGGVFFPVGDLADGMEYGYNFGINVRAPFTHLVLPSQLGERTARMFRNFDVGLHFSYLTGTSSENSSDTITFAPMLLDVFYNLPFDTGRFKVYAYAGMGVSLASTVVVRNSGSVHEQSFDFTIRPGVGAEYFFTGRVYARLNAGYFVAFESYTGMGLITSLGVGYLF